MAETQFFCAEHSRQSGVDIIGSASEHEIYIAIACPPPWASDELESKSVPDNLRLICTHGSRDRCCARLGNPLYHQALKIVKERSLNHLRIWQASHIGGHRMAATAVTFSDARYYGYLSTATLESTLTRTGDIQCLSNIYRGWGVLPWAVQVVEQQLLLIHGWDWFNYKATARVIEHNEDETYNRVELTYEIPEGGQQIYRADVVADCLNTVYLKGSCQSEKESEVIPYIIKNLTQVQPIESIN